MKNSVEPGNYIVIRTDGTTHEVAQKPTRQAIKSAISAEGIDTVNLRNGCVMIVDDTGMIDERPVNPEATEIYHSVCRPGTIHPICGDVAICFDEDFA